jgi:hypothetical protein
MADAVCRCGTYVRAYVTAGTKINCPQCGVLLTMGGEGSDSSGSGEKKEHTRPYAPSSLKRMGYWLLGGFLAIGFVSGILALNLGFQNTRSDSTIVQQSEETAVEKFQEPLVAIPKEPSFWSAQAVWIQDAQKFTQSENLQSLAEEIATAGESIEPQGFWGKVCNYREGKNPAGMQKVIQRLMASPIDSYSTFENSVGSNWSIVGMHRGANGSGILLRYFFEPLSKKSELSGVDDWVGLSQNVLGFDEFNQVTNGIFSEQASDASADLSPNESQTSIDFPTSLFTPRFGYMVLLIDSDSKGLSCSDIVSLPGEVRISSLGVDGPPMIRDVFGEYQSVSEGSMARLLFFGQDRDPEASTIDIRRFVASINKDRARRLAEIAECSQRDPRSISACMSRFRKEFPDDFGADSLLISLWFTHHQDKKMTASFEDFGRSFVESAHRLYMRTNDPLLLEVKSRVYFAHGKLHDAEKCLKDAETSNYKSLFMIQRRIRESSNARDKERLINYLAQFKDLMQGKPNAVSNRDLKSKWTQQVVEWRSVLEKK